VYVELTDQNQAITSTTNAPNLHTSTFLTAQPQVLAPSLLLTYMNSNHVVVASFISPFTPLFSVPLFGSDSQIGGVKYFRQISGVSITLCRFFESLWRFLGAFRAHDG